MFIKEELIIMIDKVLHFFNKLSQYPRSSGHEEQVANFLVEFAKERNLVFYKDKYNNVLIKKINKNKKPIILHSHTDMICVSDNDYDIDFLTSPIKTIIKDNYLSAYKTSLGADNGIGVAIILAFLDQNNDYNIEALFTADEESTMTGALNFDYSKLKSNMMVSLDGMCDDELINGCASICDMKINFTPQFKKTNLNGYQLKVCGLKGGHSGNDIALDIGNSNNILAYVLSNLSNLQIQSFNGGNQFNFIPNESIATFISNDFESKFENIKNELLETYPNLILTYEKVKINKITSEKFSLNFVNFLNKIKTGVIESEMPQEFSDLFKNPNLETLVSNIKIILSQNLSSVDLDTGLIKISQRGHDKQLEENNINFIKSIANKNNFKFEIYDKQPGFNALKNSKLTNLLTKIYEQQNSSKLKIVNKHISLEACIFKQKLPNLDVAIVSPKIYDVHSTKERVYIPSIKTTCDLLSSLLNENI